MPIDTKLGDVPSSTLSDTSNIIFTDGENVRKEAYASVKADMLGTATLATNSPKIKEGINELVQDLLESTGYGVVSGGVVSSQSTPNMTANVTGCTLKTSTGARQVVAANTALVVTTADATNPRKDIVYVDSTGVAQYLQGIAASSPTVPVTPSGGFLLAEIYVAANATSITNANITDKRKILISTDTLNAQLSDKAKNIDNTRTTTAKDVTGAINELNSNKINKTSIVNNLTATVAGSVLDATQGKILQDEINTVTSNLKNIPISDTRGTTKTPMQYTGATTTHEFKAGADLGLTVGYYYLLRTSKPWVDETVATFQEAIILNGASIVINKRVGSGSTWGAWS